MATAQKKPVLFLTNSEYGQAQVALAIAHQLLQHPQIQVHIASFPELEPRVQQLQGAIPNDESDATAGETAELAFHTLPAPSMRIAYGTTGGHARFMSHPYGIRHAANSYKYLTEVLSPWSWEQYLAIYGRCDALVEEIEPELVVCDSILSPALDFCRNGLGRTKGVERKARFVVLSPLDILHTCSLAQGLWRSLFRLPAFCSGFPYPLPLYLVPANAYLQLRLIATFLRFPAHQPLGPDRSAAGLPGPYPAFKSWKADELYLAPALPELDFSGLIVPDNVTTCGPILFPAQEVEPELGEWLRGGSGGTVLVNLGSHIESEGKDAIELAKGLKTVLDKRGDLKVLWKLASGVTAELGDLLEGELEQGRVRIVKWLDTEPVAVLRSGRVVCAVHHGGANSFYEAVGTGTPQVLLPAWYDTYDFANRVEYLGIGIWANRSAAPHVDATEFKDAVLKTVDEGEAGRRMKARAKELEVVSQRAGGRKRAAERVLVLVGG